MRRIVLAICILFTCMCLYSKADYSNLLPSQRNDERGKIFDVIPIDYEKKYITEGKLTYESNYIVSGGSKKYPSFDPPWELTVTTKIREAGDVSKDMMLMSWKKSGYNYFGSMNFGLENARGFDLYVDDGLEESRKAVVEGWYFNDTGGSYSVTLEYTLTPYDLGDWAYRDIVYLDLLRLEVAWILEDVGVAANLDLDMLKEKNNTIIRALVYH